RQNRAMSASHWVHCQISLNQFCVRQAADCGRRRWRRTGSVGGQISSYWRPRITGCEARLGPKNDPGSDRFALAPAEGGARSGPDRKPSSMVSDLSELDTVNYSLSAAAPVQLRVCLQRLKRFLFRGSTIDSCKRCSSLRLLFTHAPYQVPSGLRRI